VDTVGEVFCFHGIDVSLALDLQ